MSTFEPNCPDTRSRRSLVIVRGWSFSLVLAAIAALSAATAGAQSYPPSPHATGQVLPAGHFHPAAHYGGVQSVEPQIFQELVPPGLGRTQSPRKSQRSRAFFEPYFRFNYLHGRIEGPGSERIGAPQVGLEQSQLIGTDTFPITFNGATPSVLQPDGTAIFVPGETVDLGGFAFDSLNGFEGTLGVPLTTGTVELSAFVFDTADERQEFRTRLTGVLGLTGPVIPVIPLTNNGVPQSDLVIPFEQLSIGYVSDFWGSGAQFIMNPITPGLPLTFSPTLGGRYVRLRERLNINGSFRDLTTVLPVDPADPNSPLTDPLVYNPSIKSAVTNHIFGPTVGFRADLNSQFISLSAEPRFGFGFNRRTTRVSASQILSIDDPSTSPLDEGIPGISGEEEKTTEIAPFFELNISARAHLRPNFDLFVGYDVFVFTQLHRAARNIDYNVNGTVADIGIRGGDTEAVVQSLMIGGEYTFGRPSTGGR